MEHKEEDQATPVDICTSFKASSRIEGSVDIGSRFCGSHPILSLVRAKDNLDANPKLQDYVCGLLRESSIPYTLTEFYQGYINFLILDHLTEGSGDASEDGHTTGDIKETLNSLSCIAFAHKVRGLKITDSLVAKHLFAEGRGRPDRGRVDSDVQRISYGLLLPTVTKKRGSRKTYRFREGCVLEYLVALYQCHLCQNAPRAKLKSVMSSMWDSMRRLPEHSDLWRITFGLLSQQNGGLKYMQKRLLLTLVEQAQLVITTTSFDITSVCVDAVYESRNRGQLSGLLDEFTVNDSINYSEVQIDPARLPYIIHSVGFLVQVTGSVFGLHLSRLGVTGDNIAMLTDPANQVSEHSLQVLNLSHNKLYSKGMANLQRFLIKAPRLTHMDLSNCLLEDSGTCLLSQCLTSLPLLYLNLAGNKIRDDGLIKLVRTTKYCATLECLDLSNNLLTDDSVVQLGGALPGMPRIRKLDLRENDVGDSGMRAISNALHALDKVSRLMRSISSEKQQQEEKKRITRGLVWQSRSIKAANINLNKIARSLSLRRRRSTVPGYAAAVVTDTEDNDGEEDVVKELAMPAEKRKGANEKSVKFS